MDKPLIEPIAEVAANESGAGEPTADEAKTFAGYGSQEEKAAAKKPPPGARKLKKGLVIINTGPGKGKSTAAFGLVLRAWGRGMRVCIIQFVKHANAHFGEHRAAKKLGIEMLAMGDGFTWVTGDLDESAAKGRHGWELAQAKIASGEYDLIVLDEFTYALKYGWLDVNEVVAWLAALQAFMKTEIATYGDVALLGDYNIAPADADAPESPSFPQGCPTVLE